MTKIGHGEAVTINREIIANHLNVSIFHHILSSRYNMVQFYYKLVKAGKVSIDDVPEKYREQVRILIASE